MCVCVPEAIAASSSTPVPPEIKQMFLVLQSVHKTPPSEQYHALQGLVAQVVQPYLCMHVTSGVHPGKGSSSSSGNSNQQQSAQEGLWHTHARTHACMHVQLQLQLTGWVGRKTSRKEGGRESGKEGGREGGRERGRKEGGEELCSDNRLFSRTLAGYTV